MAGRVAVARLQTLTSNMPWPRSYLTFHRSPE